MNFLNFLDYSGDEEEEEGGDGADIADFERDLEGMLEKSKMLIYLSDLTDISDEKETRTHIRKS
jgi:hypothetical protein